MIKAEINNKTLRIWDDNRLIFTNEFSVITYDFNKTINMHMVICDNELVFWADAVI